MSTNTKDAPVDSTETVNEALREHAQLEQQETAILAKLEGEEAKLVAVLEQVRGAISKIKGTPTKPVSGSFEDGGTSPRRGRKPGSKNRFKLNGTDKTARKSNGKRGAMGAAITAFLEKAGKKGAHVSDIAKAVGNKPANVTAFFYAGAGKKLAKKVDKATFALAK